MKKMPCLFVRVFDPMRRGQFTITRTVTPGCEWVLSGEGVASRKWDGAACAVIGGALYKRYDAKKHPKTGEFRVPPEGSLPCDEPDETTGHWPHWVLASGPEDRWIREAYDFTLEHAGSVPDGTYEACGPKIGGNAEKFAHHILLRHGALEVSCPRDYDGVRQFLTENWVEGVVFAHPDGRFAKIRRDDFGLSWKGGQP